MPRLQTYADYGGKMDPAANALEGLQAGIAIKEYQSRNRARAEDFKARNKRLDIRREEEAGRQGRFEQTKKFEGEKFKHKKSQDTKKAGQEDRRLGIYDRQVTIGESAEKRAGKKYSDEQKKIVKEAVGETATGIDTTNFDTLKRTLRPFGHRLAAKLKQADLEDEAIEVSAMVEAAYDGIDKPGELEKIQAVINGYKKIAIGPEGMAKLAIERRKTDIKALGELGSKEFTMLKGFIPTVLKKYNMGVQGWQEGESTQEFMQRLMVGSKNAMDIIRQRAASGDQEAATDLAELDRAYRRLSELVGVTDTQSRPQQGAQPPGPGAGAGGAPSQTFVYNPQTGGFVAK